MPGRFTSVAAIALGLVACHSKSTPPSTESQPIDRTVSVEAAPSAVEPVESKSVAPAAQTITLSAVGDCTLGDPFGSEHAPGSFGRTFDDSGADFALPFSGVAEVLKDDDLTIANLEGTLGT